MELQPRLMPAVLASLAAAVCFVAARFLQDGSPTQMLAALFAVVFSGVAFVLGGDWLLYHLGQRLRELRTAQSISPELETMRLIASMRPENLAFMAAGIANVSIPMPSQEGPRTVLELGEGLRIPREFVEEFVSRIEGNQLPAVRSYRGAERGWARALIALAVEWQIATEARGNKPARLTVPAIILERKLGL